MIEQIFFAQGDAADDYLAMIDEHGPEHTLQYLADAAHYPGEHNTSRTPGHGSSDEVFQLEGYILSWNEALGYLGLEYNTHERKEI